MVRGKKMEKRLFNIKEVSDYTGIPINTLYAWANRKKIPYIKLNGSIKFEIHHIDKWIKKNTIKIEGDL